MQRSPLGSRCLSGWAYCFHPGWASPIGLNINTSQYFSSVWVSKRCLACLLESCTQVPVCLEGNPIYTSLICFHLTHQNTVLWKPLGIQVLQQFFSMDLLKNSPYISYKDYVLFVPKVKKNLNLKDKKKKKCLASYLQLQVHRVPEGSILASPAMFLNTSSKHSGHAHLYFRWDIKHQRSGNHGDQTAHNRSP